MSEIILASKSPRRDEILSIIGVEHSVISPEADESTVKFDPGRPAEEYVMALSRLKSDALEEVLREKSADNGVDYSENCVNSAKIASKSACATVAADTIVWCRDWRGGMPMRKPKSHEEAVEMLETLSGKTHAVLTGVTLRNRVCGEILTYAERTDVVFRNLSREEIEDYVTAHPPYDKAGAYGIQEKAAVFVREIRGEYFNVMGLPVVRLYETLHKWNYIK